jgi:hypothetical protein
MNDRERWAEDEVTKELLEILMERREQAIWSLLSTEIDGKIGYVGKNQGRIEIIDFITSFIKEEK